MGGSWLFEFFLSEVPDSIKQLYIADIYDAIVWFVNKSKPTNMRRGIEILVQLLLHLNNTAKMQFKRPPDFKKILPTAQKMEKIMDQGNVEQHLQNPVLQRIVELLATSDLVKNKFERQQQTQIAVNIATSTATIATTST